MYSEPITRRHLLFFNEFLLWKVGVKNVYNTSEKAVGIYPQLPHLSVRKYVQSRLVPRRWQFSPTITPANTTHLSTQKSGSITEVSGQFFTQSTEPITTITTYIEREGTRG